VVVRQAGASPKYASRQLKTRSASSNLTGAQACDVANYGVLCHSCNRPISRPVAATTGTTMSPFLGRLRPVRRGTVCLLVLVCVACAKEDAPVIVQGVLAPRRPRRRQLLAKCLPASTTTGCSGWERTCRQACGTPMAAGGGLCTTGTVRRAWIHNATGPRGPLAEQNGRPFILKATAHGDDAEPQDVMIGQWKTLSRHYAAATGICARSNDRTG
jgi:hypothetical protein